MKWTDIAYSKKDGVAVATLNRPECLNALRRTTLHELRGVLNEVQEDGSIRVLILSGEGRAFCAGEDLKELSELIGGEKLSDDEARDHVLELQDLTRSIVNLPKPVIAAVNGIAVGLGAELAIACDMRIASENGSFAFREVKRGLFETNGVMYLLPRLAGSGRAAEWLLTGEDVTAKTALAAGLVSRVVPDSELLDVAKKFANELAANAPISVRLVKQALKRTYDMDFEAVMQLEVDGVLECLASEDFIEGIRSFVEKRPPEFKGR